MEGLVRRLMKISCSGSSINFEEPSNWQGNVINNTESNCPIPLPAYNVMYGELSSSHPSLPGRTQSILLGILLHREHDSGFHCEFVALATLA